MLAVHHIALAARAPESLATFYSQVFGLHVRTTHRDEQGVRSVWLELGDGVLLMVERALGEAMPVDAFEAKRPGWHLIALAIAASERETWRERLRSHGVVVTHSTAFTIFVQDPEGNRIGLSHYPVPGEG